MNNGRDCEHGRRAGNCDTCDLEHAKKRIAKLEHYNLGLANEAHELKAQVEQLHKAIYRQQRKEYWHEEHPLVTLCIATPAQCLAEVKAQADADFMKALFYAPSSPVSANKAQEIEIWYSKVKELRQAAKGGE